MNFSSGLNANFLTAGTMKKGIITLFFCLILIIMNAQNQTGAAGVRPSQLPSDKIVPDKADKNNNFYDNEETYLLAPPVIIVEGEVENPGKVDFSKLPKHSVIVKETVLKDGGTDAFVGAYRYDGYSLFDILTDRIVKKKNAAEFKPVIDLYVTVENDKGEKVVLSWGEIFYPNNLHTIIVATQVMRIVPSKTKDLWPLPAESKLVVSSDLITERNISNPVRITVHSYSRSIPVNRDLDPLYSPQVSFFVEDAVDATISDNPKGPAETFNTIFYGRGRGIHSTQPFTGYRLTELLPSSIQKNKNNLQHALIAMIGKDGYRATFTYSEIMNRNDQSEVLLVPCTEEKDGGKFRIFPSGDFFSDRAVKAVSEIRIHQVSE
jgi:hypothetical protein